MAKFYLPMNSRNKYTIQDPESGRKQDILIPGAGSMDKSQLNEILEWQTEKTLKELRAPRPKRVYSKKEVGQALNEFNKALRRRQASTHNKINF